MYFLSLEYLVSEINFYLLNYLLTTYVHMLILWWYHAQELFGSQVPVTLGGFELKISYIWSNYLTHYSFVHNCSTGGRGVNCKFLGKNPQVHLIIIREWPKNTTTPHFKKPWYIPPWYILFDPPSPRPSHSLQLGTKE